MLRLAETKMIKAWSLNKRLIRCYSKKNLDVILEPHFQTGLTNYSSQKNKILMNQLMGEHHLSNIGEIKRWIDKRKRKERRKERSDNHEKQNLVHQCENFPHPSVITPLKYHRWKWYLKNSPVDDVCYVLDGIQNGFSLDSFPLNLRSAKKNLTSCYEHHDVVESYIKDELKNCTMSGPHDVLPFKNGHINRFGVIPKSSGKWRLITDLSYPKGASVNDGVSNENYAVSYVGVSSAINKVLRIGRNCLLAKFDIQRAYRLLPIKESDRYLLVMKWNDKYYVDLALPFGARSAPRIFTRFSNVLEWILKTFGPIDFIQHSLDDFLVCGPPETSVCHDALMRSFELCDDLGIPIEHSKTQGPSTRITFLGLEIDSEAMEIRIPQEKMYKIRAALEIWTNKKSGNKRSLLSLIGSLYYCCQAVVIGRPFLTRLVQRAHSVEHLHQRVVLSNEECNDLLWWFHLLNSWNGRCLLTDFSENKDVVKLHS